MKRVQHDPRDGETLLRLMGRWALASLLVSLVHGGVALAVVNWPRPENTSGEPPAAVMIELAPLPVAPEAPEEDIAVGPQQVMSEQSTPSERQDEPIEKEEPKEQRQRVKPTPEPVEREIKTEVGQPKLEEMAHAEAVLNAPAQKSPTELERVEEQEPPRQPPKDLKKAERTKPQDQAKQAAKAATAPKRIEAPRAKANAAPSSGVASSMSVATWRGAVMAHLNRHKRYPGGGAGGTSSVAFTIDRSGHVLSARLIGSSGSAVLDQEAVALARRASPLPAPPGNIGGANIVLTVPIRFSR